MSQASRHIPEVLVVHLPPVLGPPPTQNDLSPWRLTNLRRPHPSHQSFFDTLGTHDMAPRFCAWSTGISIWPDAPFSSESQQHNARSRMWLACCALHDIPESLAPLAPCSLRQGNSCSTVSTLLTNQRPNSRRALLTKCLRHPAAEAAESSPTSVSGSPHPNLRTAHQM